MHLLVAHLTRGECPECTGEVTALWRCWWLHVMNALNAAELYT